MPSEEDDADAGVYPCPSCIIAFHERHPRGQPPRPLELHIRTLVPVWRAGDKPGTMSTIEALYIFDEHK
jgi:hypothetical protein